MDDDETELLVKSLGDAFVRHIQSVGVTVVDDDDEDETEPNQNDEEAAERETQSFIEAVSQKYPIEFADLYDGFPVCPRESGLYALIAADDILIRVVSEKITDDEIIDLVRDDITNRLLKNENAKLLAQGLSTHEVMVETFPKLVALKRQYHLDKLY